MYGKDNSASFSININGQKLAFTSTKDPDHSHQSSNPAIVLKLLKGDAVTIDPYLSSSNTIRGGDSGSSQMYNWFNVILLFLL